MQPLPQDAANLGCLPYLRSACVETPTKVDTIPQTLATYRDGSLPLNEDKKPLSYE